VRVTVDGGGRIERGTRSVGDWARWKLDGGGSSWGRMTVGEDPVKRVHWAKAW